MTTHEGDANGLHPVEQTREAFGLLEALGDDHVEESMASLGRRVREIASDCVALSLSLVQSGLVFTLAAENRTGALLDAVQYLDGGPCVTTVLTPDADVLETHPGATDELRWQLFSQAGAHLGIAATLSLPVLENEDVVAGVNLYGATSTTFDDHHEQLAAVCGAWSGGAVTNADLDFESRVRAAAAPERILDRRDLDMAGGVIAALQEVTAYEAVLRIRSAAGRAGVTEGEFARFVLAAHGSDHAA